MSMIQINGFGIILKKEIKINCPIRLFQGTEDAEVSTSVPLKIMERIQSSDVTTLSGSGVNILTPQFFFGKASTSFVSGSNGNIEITSSNFHLDKDGTVKTRGEIRATSGTIGGFTIGSDLSSTAGTLKLKGATGQITASNAQISGKITATSGEIGGFAITSNAISSSNDKLIISLRFSVFSVETIS